MLMTRPKTKYLVHVCTAVNCRRWTEHAEQEPYYHTRGKPGFDGAFNAFVSIEGVDYDHLQPGERVHVLHVACSDYRVLGQRFWWRHP